MSTREEVHLGPPTQGFQYAGIYGKVTYSFVGPLLRLGAVGKINESTAAAFYPLRDRAELVSAEFEAAYASQKTIWGAYWILYRWRLLEHLLWCFLEIAVRVGSPLLLRQLLQWFSLNAAAGNEAAPPREGWAWAGALAAFSYSYVLVHHQLFWRGMRMGMGARTQAIAAVEAKALRLNAAAVADVTGGRIVNVVSNDVRRFDEAGTFWVFLIGGPLELLIVLILIGLRLGFAASIAGVSTLLLLIPSQAVLARYIGRLRAATAAQTDDRVRLTGESISGILACKMLAWEGPLLQQLRAIRAREAGYIRKMNAIRALNMALSYAITPVVSLITFATARGTGAELTVANVFYALALLSLPKLYMCEFFVHGVECVSELRVGVRRLEEFLSMPEPPPPWQESDGDGSSSSSNGGDAIVVLEADFDWSTTAAAAAAANSSTTVSKMKEKKSTRSSLPVEVVIGVDKTAIAEEESESEESDVDAAPAPSKAITLSKFSLRVPKGQLLAIVGAVGSGKSSVLAALLGELQPVHQSPAIVQVRGSVAYCQQIPWIMSGSVRENVLFGLPLDEDKFTAAVHAAAFEEDLRGMPAGADTEIGERGISISGGQKARLSLARAVYSGAAVQLMDDPLSAVDARVGRDLFTRCIGPSGVMHFAGATRVLVTHQRQYLSRCDRVVVMRGGVVVEDGTYAQLVEKGVPEVMVVAAQEGGMSEASIDEIAADTENGGVAMAIENTNKLTTAPPPPTIEEEEEDDDEDEESESSTPPTVISPPLSNTTRPGLRAGRVESTSMLSTLRSIKLNSSNNSNSNNTITDGYLRRMISTKIFGYREDTGTSTAATFEHKTSSLVGTILKKKTQINKPGGGRSGRLIVKEDQAEGSVTWGVYGALLQRLGMMPVALCVVGLLGGQALYLYSEYWLSQWASKDPVEQMDIKWVWVYAIFAITILIISICRAQLFFWAALRASTALHDAAITRLLHAPLSFFHTNPTGRVLNRFSKDLGSIDEQLPMVSFDALQALMMVVGAFTLLVVVVPFILPVFVPLGCAFFWVQRRYLKTSRELKRYEAVTRSPLYAAFSATLKGLPTIRAHRAADRFRADFLELLSANVAWWFCWLTTARWIGFRLDLLVAVLLTVAPLLMMAVHSQLSPRLVGLALTQSLYLAGMLQWMVRQAAEVENNMTSAERLLSYCRLEQEPATVAQGGAAAPPGWPSHGAIQYNDVTAVYRSGLPSVLRNISFSLPGGVSCGVVGRTGSGKSSLMLTLFRMIPITGGSICIDGVDTATVGVDVLRRLIAIIPQDPVLFSGTLRSNLDPWGECGDDGVLWEALEMAQLKAAVVALGGLDAALQEGGESISAGQRQLLCLARALLQNAAVLALDEATANVDRGTDQIIQQTVRRACVRTTSSSSAGTRSRTLLVIAHRIDTIMDCDQLLVLSHGQLVEQGPPQQLATSGAGPFASMVTAARAAVQDMS